MNYKYSKQVKSNKPILKSSITEYHKGILNQSLYYDKYYQQCQDDKWLQVQSSKSKASNIFNARSNSISAQPTLQIITTKSKISKKKNKCLNCLSLLSRGFSTRNCPCHKKPNKL